MPSNLYSTCIDEISKSVVDFCVNSTFENPNQNTETINNLREDFDNWCTSIAETLKSWISVRETKSLQKGFWEQKYEFFTSNIPEETASRILNRSLSLWRRMKSEMTSLTKAQKRQVLCLILKFFQGNTSNWTLELNENHPLDMEFISMFKREIVHLKISSLSNAKPISLLETLLCTLENLTILDLAFSSDISNAFKVIGQNCCKLQVLKGKTSELKMESAFKLCFKDYPDNTIKNPCCSTLTVLDIIPETKQNNLIVYPDPCVILLNNMPKLVNLGEGFSFDSILKTSVGYEDDYIFPSSIQQIHVLRGCKTDYFTEVIEKFPNLKAVSVKCGLFSFTTKYTFYNHKTTTSVDFVPVAHFFEDSKWDKLVSLKIASMKIMDSLDLSVYTQFWPNLEILSLENCVQFEILENYKPFQKLRELQLKYTLDHRGNFNILHLVSRTVKAIICNVSGLGSFDQVTAEHSFTFNILMHRFPLLERILFGQCLSLKERIMDVVRHCPKLQKLGHVHHGILDEIQEEIGNLNQGVQLTY